MRRPADFPTIHRPAEGISARFSHFLPEVLLCMCAIALSLGLRIVAFLH